MQKNKSTGKISRAQNSYKFTSSIHFLEYDSCQNDILNPQHNPSTGGFISSNATMRKTTHTIILCHRLTKTVTKALSGPRNNSEDAATAARKETHLATLPAHHWQAAQPGTYALDLHAKSNTLSTTTLTRHENSGPVKLNRHIATAIQLYYGRKRRCNIAIIPIALKSS